MREGAFHPGELDLNLLWALDALLREKHVSKAAESVGLGQPAMSAALKRLRMIFKDELLVRQGNRYFLTPLAANIEDQTHAVIQNIGRLFTHKPAFDPATSDRTFVICAGEYPSDVLLSRVVESVFQMAPRVNVEIRRLNGRSRDDFRAGQVDILIQAPAECSEPLDENAHCQPLFHDRWVCAVWRGNLEVGDVLTMEQYKTLPQVGYGSEGKPRPTEKQHAGALQWAEPRPVDVWTHSLLSIPGLVEGTRMFALIPVLLAEMIVHAGDVRLADLPFEAPELHYSMYWHPMFEADRGNVWLRGVLMDCAQRLGQRKRVPVAV